MTINRNNKKSWDKQGKVKKRQIKKETNETNNKKETQFPFFIEVEEGKRRIRDSINETRRKNR